MLIAGPNLTFDRTGRINVLSPGAVLRFTEVVVTPGGKGLNVARTARALDAPATLVAFVPGFTGRAAAEMISQEGVTLVGVPSAGETRFTSVILEPDGRATVLNEPGPRIDAAAWDALERTVHDHLAERMHELLQQIERPGEASPPSGYPATRA